jgi:hypothetical protein
VAIYGGGLYSDESTHLTLEKAMPNPFVCLRVHIPKPVAAPINDDDLAIATAAVCHASSSLDDCTLLSSPVEGTRPQLLPFPLPLPAVATET